ncbi:MAG: hypothetical protein RMX68_011510 [Aulosira sp. ZfuVER01]|nr:hypothetical protein [Aulosira sp. ZfuVER01]MDZ8002871.1 hypothetical protein [Aulosira sp. DedVER01a]MDZ8056450.1 hypothetical protein [Aulosira sp. ZfuCHP01]
MIREINCVDREIVFVNDLHQPWLAGDHQGERLAYETCIDSPCYQCDRIDINSLSPL